MHDLKVTQENAVQTTHFQEEFYDIEDTTFNLAKTSELNSWKENKVYQEVKYNSQRCPSVRWVCTIKQSNNNLIPKARLVVRGFEEINRHELNKESPTCSKDTLRTVVSTAKQKKWKIKSIDIKTAFLQGELVSREIYVTPPVEANVSKGTVWKLNKCVYGLVDAPRLWYKRVKSFMLSAGARISNFDPAVFSWHDGS